ncbi:unnamed protein product [Prunus armeniaca]
MTSPKTRASLRFGPALSRGTHSLPRLDRPAENDFWAPPPPKALTAGTAPRVVAEANWRKLICVLLRLDFRNQSNKSPVKGFETATTILKIIGGTTDNEFNNIPEEFVEHSWEAVRARCLVSSKLVRCNFDFLFSEMGKKGGIHL